MSLCFSYRLLFNGTTSHPFFNWAGQLLHIWITHSHTLLRTPPHTHSLRQTHSLTHSLEVGARSDRAISSGCSRHHCTSGGETIPPVVRENARSPGNTESLALPCPLDRTVSPCIYVTSTKLSFGFAWGKWLGTKRRRGTECDVYLKTLVNIYCDICTNYYVILSAIDWARRTICAVCHLD